MRYSIGKGGIGEDTSIPPSTRNLFLFKTSETNLRPEDTEVSEARFVTIDEALALLTHPKDVEFLKSIRTKVEAV